MAKKSKRSIHHQKGLALPRLLGQQVSHAQKQMLQGDFPGTISTCEPLLSSLPRHSSLHAEVLILLGLAHSMLHHYQESYDLFTEVLTIDPTNAEVWYNRGLACRFTTRFAQAVCDFERAVALSKNDSSELTRTFVTELEISRKDLQEAMREHETSITFEQFIEREERFMHAMSLMRQSKWREAEQAFRQVIEMGGGLPQYWGNLGVSLIMQIRYEEAEAALRRALEIDPHYTLARTNLEKIPEVRRAGGPLGIELRDLSQVPGIKQSIAFSEQGQSGSSPATHTTIEKAGKALKRTGKPLGKQPPQYRFFLNPYRDARFTTCPQCGLRTRQRKCPLVIHIHSVPTLILGKTCRYCVTCDLLIAHQDQVEEQIALYAASSHPEITGNNYLVMGTLDRPEWRKGIQDPLSIQEMVEHLHDFKEVVTFQRAYV